MRKSKEEKTPNSDKEAHTIDILNHDTKMALALPQTPN
jgi:hypothetical protein